MSPGAIHRGLLLVLSAPSGTGKTTLARRFVQARPDAAFSISVTTREPRGAERDGVDYRFVDSLTFQQMIEHDELVEWAEVHGNFYGSPLSAVDRAFSSGGIAVFDIDVQGGQSIQRRYPEAVLVFVLPPSMAELERRLRDRGTESEDAIRRRMLAARSEVEH
ncbi:MAG TPA: guanylate kinase, partial [Myxococcaceae bacterium]|nr:guanylate kinase [Myxococcaceae bacterium]